MLYNVGIMTYTLTNSENDEKQINPDPRMIRSVLDSLPESGFAILVNDDTQDFAQVLNQSPIGQEQIFYAEYVTTTNHGRKASQQSVLDQGLPIGDVVVFLGEYMDGTEQYKRYPHSSGEHKGSLAEKIGMILGIIFMILWIVYSSK